MPEAWRANDLTYLTTMKRCCQAESFEPLSVSRSVFISRMLSQTAFLLPFNKWRCVHDRAEPHGDGERETVPTKITTPAEMNA